MGLFFLDVGPNFNYLASMFDGLDSIFLYLGMIFINCTWTEPLEAAKSVIEQIIHTFAGDFEAEVGGTGEVAPRSHQGGTEEAPRKQ